ncbi:manganese catalase family protein [Alkaliphilus sp. B6464]|uniref:manganese catalase family protein n=1 Tax=Alkaliphilus sp. B6464 TaxID=2731219 RepID=UPI002FE6DAAE
MIYQLTKDATVEELEAAGLGSNYAIRNGALFPSDANGVPWTAAYIQAHADPITDLHEDMAAEQKARSTYQHLIKLTDDPGITDALRFLREREVVHFQRFGEALRIVQEYMQCKKIF